MATPDFWSQPEKGHKLMQDRKRLEEAIASDSEIVAMTSDLETLFELSREGEAVEEEILEEIRRLRRERAAGGDATAFRKFFRRDLHTALVRNLQRIGLLTPRVAPSLESLGISLAAAS